MTEAVEINFVCGKENTKRVRANLPGYKFIKRRKLGRVHGGLGVILTKFRVSIGHHFIMLPFFQVSVPLLCVYFHFLSSQLSTRNKTLGSAAFSTATSGLGRALFTGHQQQQIQLYNNWLCTKLTHSPDRHTVYGSGFICLVSICTRKCRFSSVSIATRAAGTST